RSARSGIRGGVRRGTRSFGADVEAAGAGPQSRRARSRSAPAGEAEPRYTGLAFVRKELLRAMFPVLASIIDLLHALLMLAWVAGLPLLFWHRFPRAAR